LHKRRISIIIEWLEEEGPLSTREVYDLWLDRYPKKCPTMYELANMLSRTKLIEKHTFATNERTTFNNRSFGSKWTGHTVWRLKEEVL